MQVGDHREIKVLLWWKRGRQYGKQFGGIHIIIGLVAFANKVGTKALPNMTFSAVPSREYTLLPPQ